MTPEVLVAIGITLTTSGLSGAAVWGAARTRLKNVENTARELATRVTKHEDEDVAQHTEIVQRLTRMETLLESIDKRI